VIAVGLNRLDDEDYPGVTMGQAAELLDVQPAFCVASTSPTWVSGLPELVAVARYASKHAAHNPDLVGSAEIFNRFADEPVPVSIRPVFLSGHLAGNLISFEDLGGTRGSSAAADAERPGGWWRRGTIGWCCCNCRRCTSLRAEGNDVWLDTERGRLRSALRRAGQAGP
jgi:hypothetical protein